jgi:hypothetical protein
MTYKRLTFEGPAIAPGKRTRAVDTEPFRSQWMDLHNYIENFENEDIALACHENGVSLEYARTLGFAS